MSNRDDFPEKTKRALALRAGHRCSFGPCWQLTAGPSDESPDAVNMVGEAAHIHAASRGGKRYLESMLPEDRADISNGIWLCATHARIIDRDDVTYTGEALRAMKHNHEARCANEQRNASSAELSPSDLIALGPNIVFVGEFVAADDAGWCLHLRNFVEGDIHKLLAFIDLFQQTPAGDRYVLVNALGDGRVLGNAPSLTKDASGYILRCPVLRSAPRISATDLPKTFALSENHDLNAKWELVSGLEALPAYVKTSLSHQRGESPFHRESGTRIAEYFRLLSGSPWLAQFLKLEVIRQAAIPYIDPTGKREYTLLQCIDRVFGIETRAESPSNNWLPIWVDFEVKGVGRWQHDLSICVPTELAKRPSLKELMGGPLK